MSAKMSIEQILLILAIVFLPITYFHIDLPFIGGIPSRLFLIVGICITIYKIYAKKDALDSFERFLLHYLLICFFWQCICTLVGILEYDYYNMVYLEQMDKLRYLMQTFNSMGVAVSDVTAIQVWLGLRFLKDNIVYFVFTYGISAWIYHIYNRITIDSERKETVISHVVLAISLLCVMMASYSLIEIGYLRGNKICADILSYINPLLYKVKIMHGWWPPLLWKNQLRSLFVEPSYFGLASAFITPFLIYKVLKTEKIFSIFIYVVYCMMLFMTRARTGAIIFLGQIALLILLIVGFNRTYVKRALNIFVLSVVSFCVALYLMLGFRTVATSDSSTFNIQAETSKFINENVVSVVGNKRSNSARFASVRAHLLTGLQHPLFGVGRGMGNAYVNANFTAEDLANREVGNWSKYVKQEGVLKAPIPGLNQLSVEIAQFGVIGLILYVLPVIYIVFVWLRKLKSGLSIEMGCAFVAYVGSIAALFSNTAFLTYYILTGIMFLLLHNEAKERNCNHEFD